MSENWNRMLEPPPGGLPRLISTIQSAEKVRPYYRYAVAIAAAIALIVGIAFDRRPTPGQKLRDALTSALGERGRVYVENGAALELPSAHADVRMFVIAQMPQRD